MSVKGPGPGPLRWSDRGCRHKCLGGASSHACSRPWPDRVHDAVAPPLDAVAPHWRLSTPLGLLPRLGHATKEPPLFDMGVYLLKRQLSNSIPGKKTYLFVSICIGRLDKTNSDFRPSQLAAKHLRKMWYPIFCTFWWGIREGSLWHCPRNRLSRKWMHVMSSGVPVPTGRFGSPSGHLRSRRLSNPYYNAVMRESSRCSGSSPGYGFFPSSMALPNHGVGTPGQSCIHSHQSKTPIPTK